MKTKHMTNVFALQPAHKAQKTNGMKNCNILEDQTPRRILPIACATALAAAFTVALPRPVHADDPVPAPEGNQVFLVTHSEGTQNYICLPSATSDTGVAYILFTPEATLFKGADIGNPEDKQLITHYFSPNPSELNADKTDKVVIPALNTPGKIRATWQHKDTSTVWAKKSKGASPDPTAIDWLLLEVVGAQAGPTGGNTLTPTTFIQRVNTVGGLAPSVGCAQRKDIGNQAFVPYQANYIFYKKAD